MSQSPSKTAVASAPPGARIGSEYRNGWDAVNLLIRQGGSLSARETNNFYVNCGDGTFADASGITGLDFPEDGRAFAVGDLDRAMAESQAVVFSMEELGLTAGRTFVAEEEAALRGKQPLANAGWGGLLVIMFLALALASATGIALYSWLDTRERQTEFALLRTLGSTRGQLNGVVWFNLAIVVIAGVAVGTWAGAQIGAALLPVLEVAEGGVRATPPLTFETDWRMLALAYAVLAIVSMVTVVWLAFVTSRLEVQRVLRAGEGG